MEQIYPKENSQEFKVLMKLIEADNEWTSGQVFLHGLYYSQFHRAIWNLENRFHWKIEHSKFKDEYGFLSYRLASEVKQTPLFEVKLSRLEAYK